MLRLLAIKQDENDYLLLFNYPETVVRDLVEEYGLNRRVFRGPPSYAETKFRLRVQPELGARSREPAKPPQEGDQLRHRQAGTGAYARLPGCQAQRPPAGGGPQRQPTALPARGDRSRLCSKMARARGRPPKKLTLYTDNFPWSVKSAQVFIFNMRQLGIEVDLQYFDFLTLQEKLTHRGSRGTSPGSGIHAAYPDPAGVFVPLLCGTLRGTGQRSEPAHGLRSGQGLGRPRD